MKPLLLLHGAIGSRDGFDDLQQALADQYEVHTMNFPGHGDAEESETFSIPLFADAVRHYCEAHSLSEVYIFGYSMGGYVALYLANHYPQLVARVATLATKFHWNEATAIKETAMLQGETIEAKVPQFAESLKRRHGVERWKGVLQKTVAMLEGLGRKNALEAEDFVAIQQPVLLMLGDRDKMVSLEETVTIHRGIKKSSMAVLPQTAHPIESVDTDLLSFHLKRFFS